MRFYAACLASYNNGVLHGRWIEASTDTDAMQDEINAMLRQSRFPNVTVQCPVCEGRKETTFHSSETGATRQGPCYECNGAGTVASAEEWAIHDHEGFPASFGEYAGLDAVAELVELAEDFEGQIDADDIADIVNHFGTVAYAAEALRDNFAGVHSSFHEYALEAADEALDAHEANDFTRRYFDYDQYEHELKMEMSAVEISNGVAIFHQ